jgi:hypothetical protein
MTNETNHASPNGHGSYERRDIRAATIIYFLIGLSAFLVISDFVATGVYHFLEHRAEAGQTPVSPLITNAPADTRHLPTDYRDYLKQNFPSPQLEIDERTQLNDIRLNEEQILSTYGYVDEKAGVVRIPIERAMDLIAQRGLPVREQATTAQAPTPSNAKGRTKGTKQ